METPARTPSKSRRPPSSAHRKSQSSSALSSLGMPESTPLRRGSAHPPLDDVPTYASVATALHNLQSLRSSRRHRLHALRQIEAALVSTFTPSRRSDSITLEEFLSFKCHEPILALLGRHTASLAKRGSTTSLAPGDELATHVMPEVNVAASILQGLCILSKACKVAAGQKWAMEMFLDLILQLRVQLPLEGAHPTVFYLLELLSCVMVDMPQNARVFEDLTGLEAVMRVLRGSGVDKQVRMKACEVLYFYMQPEDGEDFPEKLGDAAAGDVLPTRNRLDTPEPQSFISQDATSQSIRPETDTPPAHQSYDNGLPFIPQTPRKPPQPKLGFQTPSAHRREPSSSSAGRKPNLDPVPHSPRSDTDDGSLTKRDSAAWAEAQQRMNARDGRVSSSSSSASSVSALSAASSTSNVSSDSSTIVPSKNSRHRPSMSASAVLTPPSPAPGLARSSSSRASSSRPSSSSARAISSSTASRPKATTQAALDADTGLVHRGNRLPSKSPLVQSTTAEQLPHHRPRLSRGPSSTPGPTRSSSSAPGVQRSKGFPSELTRGILPGASASSSPVPLTPSRRVASGLGGRSSDEGKRTPTRSVAEKKELLGKWLGNVDQLVEGVEKAGFLVSK